MQNFTHPNKQKITVDHSSTSEKLCVEEERNFMFSFNETIKNEDMTEASFFTSWMCVKTGKGCETSVLGEVRNTLLP